MPAAAVCEKCANDPYSPTSTQQIPNLPVVFAVLGAFALVALLVAIVVPIVRRRLRRRGSILSPRGTVYSKARTSDIDDGVDLPSRPSSLLHQKMFSGPDKRPLLPLILDPLRPISAISWSDLRTSLSNSPHSRLPSLHDDAGDSDDSNSYHLSLAMAADEWDLESFPTNHATTSHRSASRSTTSTRGAIEDGARPSLPPSQRSPTPPGLPSKRGSPAVTSRRASLPITPISPSDSNPLSPSRTMQLFAPASSSVSSVYSPLSPLSPDNLSRNNSHLRSTMHKTPGMDPVPEDADAGEYAETRSLHQLPSPPASPDQSHLNPGWRTSTSSFSSSRRRPSLTGRQSAPNALPFRPRSSTGPGVALPLTAAFQTSVLRSGSSSSASGTLSSSPKYPPIVSVPQFRDRDRSRPKSVSVSSSAASHSPPPLSTDVDSSMARPIEAFRRLTTTDVRHRQPYSSRGEDPDARAFLCSSDALRIPQVTEASPSRHRHAAVYQEPADQPQAPFAEAQSSRNPLGPPPSFGPPPTSSTARPNVPTRTPGLSAASPAVSWKSLASGSRGPLPPQPKGDNKGGRSRSSSVRSVGGIRPLPTPPVPSFASNSGHYRNEIKESDERKYADEMGRKA